MELNYQQLEILAEVFQVGDRLILFEGSIAQVSGTVISFRDCHHADGLFPVIMTDTGYPMLVSYEWHPRRLADVDQLSLALWVIVFD